MSETQAETRQKLQHERRHLLTKIDELTVGGEIDLDFDDDFADRGQVAGEQGENQILAGTLKTQLTHVEQAITRIDDGSYGACTVCSEPISAERLAALPVADRCITHA